MHRPYTLFKKQKNMNMHTHQLETSLWSIKRCNNDKNKVTFDYILPQKGKFILFLFCFWTVFVQNCASVYDGYKIKSFSYGSNTCHKRVSVLQDRPYISHDTARNYIIDILPQLEATNTKLVYHLCSTLLGPLSLIWNYFDPSMDN